MKDNNIMVQIGNRPMRITDSEMSLIKNTFADNDILLKLLRKLFLPTIDVEAPLGEVIDLWQTVEIDRIPAEEAIINIKAMKMLIDYIERNLVQIKYLAGTKEETIEETKQRLLKNSAK